MGRRSRPLLNAVLVALLATLIGAPAAILAITPPSLAMSFSPTAVGPGGTSTLTFTVFNPEGNPTLTGLAFTDTLPAGLSVVNHSSTPVCFDNLGALTTSGGNTIAFTRPNLPETWQCQFSVDVTASSSGVFVNTTGPVSSTNGGTGNTATATLTVRAPPTIAKSFGATTLTLGDSTSLTFTITNPNSDSALTGIAFDDTFPSGGLVVAYPNGLTGSCGGGTITADPSSGAVSLAGASLGASASCTFSIDIIGAAPGTWVNTTDPVTSNEGGTGGTASASIKVGTPGTIGMAFDPPSIPFNGTSALTITLYNPETSDTDLLGAGLTDTLPAGLTVEDSSASVCYDGTLTTSGGNTISLSGDSLFIGWSCSFTVVVTGPGVAGAYTNTAGPITSEGGIPGNIASATLYVMAPPAIAMAFHPATITIGGQASLTFTLTNPAPNAADITGVAVAASLPAGLTVADGSLSGCGGTLTTSGGNTISLSGATVAVGLACTFSVDVTGVALGNHTSTSGAVTSTNSGTGNTATASVVVAAPAATPSPTSAPTSAAATPPPTSTDRSDAPSRSDPVLLLILVLAFVVGFIAVRRAQLRGQYLDVR